MSRVAPVQLDIAERVERAPPAWQYNRRRSEFLDDGRAHHQGPLGQALALPYRAVVAGAAEPHGPSLDERGVHRLRPAPVWLRRGLRDHAVGDQARVDQLDDGVQIRVAV